MNSSDASRYATDPGRSKPGRNSPWWVLAAIVIGISVIPTVGYVVGVGLDPSWGLGLHLALREDLAFGRDVAYTFGPLGFIVAPTMGFRTTGLLAYWFRLPAFSLVAWFVLRQLGHMLRTEQMVLSARLRSPVYPARSAQPVSTLQQGASAPAGRGGNRLRTAAQLLLAFPLTWLLIGALGAGGNIVVALYGIAASIAAHTLLTGGAPHVSVRSLTWASIASGLALLIRFDTGLAGLGLTVVIALLHSRTTLLRVLMVFVATVVATWILLGQPLGTFPGYAQHALELGRGYGGGMAWSAHPSWTTPVLAIAVALTTVVIARSGKVKRPTPLAIAALLVLAVTTWQQSFGRYDTGHVLRLVVMCAALVLLFAAPTPNPAFKGTKKVDQASHGRTVSVANRVLVATTVAFLLLVGMSLNDVGQPFPRFGWPKGEVPFVHPSSGWRYAWRSAEYTVSPAKARERTNREHARLPSLVPVPASVLAVARGRTVHVEPLETSLVWVYGWKWRPLPVFQTFQANTPALDDLNAATIMNPAKAPEVIVMQSTAIDGRVPRWTSPRTMLQTICHYRPAASEGGYTAWTRRSESACSESGPGRVEPRSLQPSKLANELAAMDPAANTIVYIRFQRDRSVAQRLQDKPFVIDVNGQPKLHWVTAALAEGPNIVRLPACLREALGPNGGMYPNDITPTGVPASVTGFTVEIVPYKC